MIELNNTCKQCSNDVDLMVSFTDHGVCGKCTRRNHQKAVGRLVNDNPTVPAEVYNIEASQEVADLYVDIFGY